MVLYLEASIAPADNFVHIFPILPKIVRTVISDEVPNSHYAADWSLREFIVYGYYTSGGMRTSLQWWPRTVGFTRKGYVMNTRINDWVIESKCRILK